MGILWRSAALALPMALGGCAVVNYAMPGAGDRGDEPSQTPKAVAEAPLTPPQKALGQDWTVAQSTLVLALAEVEPTSSSWINPDSGTMGMIWTKPGSNGCRAFDMTIFRKDASERLSGEACQGRKGWAIEGLRPIVPEP